MTPSKSEAETFRKILQRVAQGMATAKDADELKRLMHEAWARNAERDKKIIKLSERASFMQNGKKSQ